MHSCSKQKEGSTQAARQVNQLVDGASGWQLRPFRCWTTIVKTEMEQGAGRAHCYSTQLLLSHGECRFKMLLKCSFCVVIKAKNLLGFGGEKQTREYLEILRLWGLPSEKGDTVLVSSCLFFFFQFFFCFKSCFSATRVNIDLSKSCVAGIRKKRERQDMCKHFI